MQAREGFCEAAREHSLRLSELRMLTKREPQVGEIVISSLTRESGRIVRIVLNEDIRGTGSTGTSLVVQVPADAPKREQLWHDSEILRYADSNPS